MATIKLLKVNAEKGIAFVKVSGNTTKAGFERSKTGFVGYTGSGVDGDVIEDPEIKYGEVSTRESIVDDGTIFTWLVF